MILADDTEVQVPKCILQLFYDLSNASAAYCLLKIVSEDKIQILSI
jgi:hypothetical protein